MASSTKKKVTKPVVRSSVSKNANAFKATVYAEYAGTADNFANQIEDIVSDAYGYSAVRYHVTVEKVAKDELEKVLA